MPKKISKRMVPHDAEGNQLSYDESWLQGITYHENTPFRAKLKFDGWDRGRSAVTIYWRDENNKRYTMFMVDLAEVFFEIENGTLTGEFQVRKAGANFGVCKIGP